MEGFLSFEEFVHNRRHRDSDPLPVAYVNYQRRYVADLRARLFHHAWRWDWFQRRYDPAQRLAALQHRWDRARTAAQGFVGALADAVPETPASWADRVSLAYTMPALSKDPSAPTGPDVPELQRLQRGVEHVLEIRGAPAWCSRKAVCQTLHDLSVPCSSCWSSNAPKVALVAAFYAPTPSPAPCPLARSCVGISKTFSCLEQAPKVKHRQRL